MKVSRTCHLGAERAKGLTDKLLNRLAEEEALGNFFSRRDLLYGSKAKLIIDDLREATQGFNRVRDINWVIDHMLQSGWLKEIKVKPKTGPEKTILQVVATAGNMLSC